MRIWHICAIFIEGYQKINKSEAWLFIYNCRNSRYIRIVQIKKTHNENADKQKQKTFWIKHVVKPRKVIKVDADELFSGHWISLQCLQASNKTILWYALLWTK